MADINSWIPIVGSLTTALAALGGVALTQAATRRRDLDARLWDKRAEAYVAAVRWLLDVRACITDANGRPATDQVVEFSIQRIAFSPDLEAQVSAYASDRVRGSVESCVDIVAALQKDPLSKCFDITHADWLGFAIDSALDAAREELRGKNSEEDGLSDRLLRFRISVTSGVGSRLRRFRHWPARRRRLRDVPAFRPDL
jgi:hypothetical protein